MAKTITLYNRKGGVGKTTTAGTLMSYLTEKGKRVLGVDLDGQANLTLYCNVNPEEEVTVIDLLSGQAEFKDVVKHTRFGDLLPTNSDMDDYVHEFGSNMLNIGKMREILTKVDKDYDYIIIDCPPSRNAMVLSVLMATKYLIIPTVITLYSMKGIKETSSIIEEIREGGNKDLKVLGVLLCKYIGKRNLTKAFEPQIEEYVEQDMKSKVFKTAIPLACSVEESQGLLKSIFEYDNKGKVAKAYREFIEEMLKEID